MNKSSHLRPITAQPFTRLSKATSISAHRHQWHHRGTIVGQGKKGVPGDISLDQGKLGSALLISGTAIVKRKKSATADYKQEGEGEKSEGKLDL